MRKSFKLWLILCFCGTLPAVMGRAQQIQSVVVTPNSVAGSAHPYPTVTVTLGQAAPANVTVRLSAVTASKLASWAGAAVPSAITVPAGATSASAPVATLSVPQAESGFIRATLDGVNNSYGYVKLLPSFIVGLDTGSGVLAPGQARPCTVYLACAAPSNGATIQISTSDTYSASNPRGSLAPAFVKVPPGADRVTFDVTGGLDGGWLLMDVASKQAGGLAQGSIQTAGAGATLTARAQQSIEPPLTTGYQFIFGLELTDSAGNPIPNTAVGVDDPITKTCKQLATGSDGAATYEVKATSPPVAAGNYTFRFYYYNQSANTTTFAVVPVSVVSPAGGAVTAPDPAQPNFVLPDYLLHLSSDNSFQSVSGPVPDAAYRHALALGGLKKPALQGDRWTLPEADMLKSLTDFGASVVSDVLSAPGNYLQNPGSDLLVIGTAASCIGAGLQAAADPLFDYLCATGTDDVLAGLAGTAVTSVADTVINSLPPSTFTPADKQNLLDVAAATNVVYEVANLDGTKVTIPLDALSAVYDVKTATAQVIGDPSNPVGVALAAHVTIKNAGTQSGDRYVQISVRRMQPKGPAIVFGEGTDGNENLCYLDLSNPPAVMFPYPAALTPSHPSLSLDGSRIVFNNQIGVSQGDIYEINSDGTGLQQLTYDGSSQDNAFPCWSPRGDQIVWRKTVNGAQQFYMMSADGADPVPVTSFPASLAAGQPRWSPDGSSLAFFAYGADGVLGVWTTSAEHPMNSLRELAERQGVDAWDGPQWAPDGRYVAYVADGDVWAVPVGAVNPIATELTPRLADVTSIAGFSRDGTVMFFIRGGAAAGTNGDIWSYSLSTGVLQDLTMNPGPYDTASVWDYGSEPGMYSVITTIPVGSEPNCLTADGATNMVYVGDAGDGVLSVIDGHANAVVDAVPLGYGLNGAAMDDVTNRIYVCGGNNSLAIIDGVTDTVLTTLQGLDAPFSVDADPATNLVYVANENETVSVIDGGTGRIDASVPVGYYLENLAVNASTDTIYVCDGQTQTVKVVDGATNAVTDTIGVGNHPAGIAVDPATNRIYVSNQADGTVSVIDGATNAVIDTIRVGDSPWGVGVNTATNRIYVVNGGDGTVSVIDGRTSLVIATIPVGNRAGQIAVNQTTNRLYVGNYGDNTVSVIQCP